MTSTLDASPRSASSDGGALTQAKDVALEKTGEVRQKVGSQLTSRVREQADERSTMVGEQVSSIASALKETSTSLRTKGNDTPAKALDTVTDQVEKLGSYLTDTDGEKLLHDIEDAARQRPWAVAATLFGVGFAASRILGSSSKQRYQARTTGQVGGGYSSYPTGTTGTTVAGGLTPSEMAARTAIDGGSTNGNY